MDLRIITFVTNSNECCVSRFVWWERQGGAKWANLKWSKKKKGERDLRCLTVQCVECWKSLKQFTSDLFWLLWVTVLKSSREKKDSSRSWKTTPRRRITKFFSELFSVILICCYPLAERTAPSWGNRPWHGNEIRSLETNYLLTDEAVSHFLLAPIWSLKLWETYKNI